MTCTYVTEKLRWLCTIKKVVLSCIWVDKNVIGIFQFLQCHATVFLGLLRFHYLLLLLLILLLEQLWCGRACRFGVLGIEQHSKQLSIYLACQCRVGQFYLLVTRFTGTAAVHQLSLLLLMIHVRFLDLLPNTIILSPSFLVCVLECGGLVMIVIRINIATWCRTETTLHTECFIVALQLC